MSIPRHYPGCAAILSIPDYLTGTVAICGKCKMSFTIPAVALPVATIQSDLPNHKRHTHPLVFVLAVVLVIVAVVWVKFSEDHKRIDKERGRSQELERKHERQR